jgi:holo-[acyl-carrier protein] synthase
VILGIGADLCRIDRIRFSFERLGEGWIDLSFGADEKAQSLATSDPGIALATGYSCKEACAKALGTGFARGVDPRDIEVMRRESALVISLRGAAQKRARRITPRRHRPEILVTVGSSKLLICSFVILQATSDA